jgi:nucleoside-diphosphate-sugar epimerase
MPGVVYGPGDHSLIGDLMQLYFRGFFPIMPGPKLTLTFAHVDDVAQGHILAAEKGNAGESYLLTGPVMSLLEAAQLWSQISGRPEPLLYVPGRFLKPFASIMKALGKILPLPSILSHDAIAILEATYIASSNKARRELGWMPRSAQEGMQQTYQWLSENSPKRVAIVDQIKTRISELNITQRRQLAIIALCAALGMLVAWMIRNRKRQSN